MICSLNGNVLLLAIWKLQHYMWWLVLIKWHQIAFTAHSDTHRHNIDTTTLACFIVRHRLAESLKIKWIYWWFFGEWGAEWICILLLDCVIILSPYCPVPFLFWPKGRCLICCQPQISGIWKRQLTHEQIKNQFHYFWTVSQCLVLGVSNSKLLILLIFGAQCANNVFFFFI